MESIFDSQRKSEKGENNLKFVRIFKVNAPVKKSVAIIVILKIIIQV